MIVTLKENILRGFLHKTLWEFCFMFCIPDEREPFFKVFVSFAVCCVGIVLILKLTDVKQVVNLRIFHARLFGKLSP